METVEIRAGDLLLRAWRPTDAEAVTRACQDPVLQYWAPSLPSPYTLADGRQFVVELAPQARIFGTAPPTLTAGPVRLRPPGAGDLTAVLVANQDPQIARWFGVAQPYTEAEVGNDASRRVAEKVGFTMEGLVRQGYQEDGRHRDCWIASMLSTDLVSM